MRKIIHRLTMLTGLVFGSQVFSQGYNSKTLLSWHPYESSMQVSLYVNNILNADKEISVLEELIDKYRSIYPKKFVKSTGTVMGYSPYSIYTALLLDIENDIKMSMIQTHDLGKQSYIQLELFKEFNRVSIYIYNSNTKIIRGVAAKTLLQIMESTGYYSKEDPAYPGSKVVSLRGEDVRIYSLMIGSPGNLQTADLQCGYVKGGIRGIPGEINNEYTCLIQ